MSTEVGTHELGQRFRIAVGHVLAQAGAVITPKGATWLHRDGQPIALRYSKCYVRGERTEWWYGIGEADRKQLGAAGALAFVLPHETGHRFALLEAGDARRLLRRCKVASDGHRKFHVLYESTTGTFRLKQWPNFDLTSHIHVLTKAALAAASITSSMGLSGHEIRRRRIETSKQRNPSVSRSHVSRAERDFDASRIPRLSSPKISTIDPSVTWARREQANRAHQQLVAKLDRYLRSSGWLGVKEIPGAIDLWARPPACKRKVIFECKSMTNERPETELSRCRAGLAQLLEYRFDYGRPDDALCLVTDGPISERRVRFLESVGVAVVCFRDAVPVCQGMLATKLLGSISVAHRHSAR